MASTFRSPGRARKHLIITELPHRPLGDVAIILKAWFSKALFSNSLCRILACAFVKLLPGNDTKAFKWEVNIGLVNGLVPTGTKPLAETMLTQIYVAKWPQYTGHNELTTRTLGPVEMCHNTWICNIWIHFRNWYLEVNTIWPEIIVS